MKVLFAGTPDFAVPPLQALAREHEIVGVFTQPDRKSGRGKKITPSPVKSVAKSHNFTVLQPISLRDQADVIKALKPDVMVVVAYGMLLPQSILDIPRLGCINIHASILPRWRGAAPIQRAIEAGDKEAGISIMRMELGLDTGPVYQTLITAIEPNDTSAILHDKLSKLGADGIVATLGNLSSNPKLQPTKQCDIAANYAKKISKSESQINWSMSATEIDRRIRAFNPWPICETAHKGVRIRVWQSTPLAQLTNQRDGEIVDVGDDGIQVACNKTVLRLDVLQRDGNKALTAREFLNGYDLRVGEIFGTVTCLEN